MEVVQMNDSSRIIGDFMEIHSDIIEQEANSKAPKIIKNMRKKKYLKRLKKSISKLASSKMILDRDNLAEYFIFLYNNFSPNGTFRSTYRVSQRGEEFERMEAVLKFEDIYSLIKINQEDPDGFDIIVRKNGTGDQEQKSCTVRVNRLQSNNPYTQDLLSEVNSQLLKDMSEFLDQIIFGTF
jgi:hypothetical protein